jgi:hypothetical protein
MIRKSGVNKSINKIRSFSDASSCGSSRVGDSEGIYCNFGWSSGSILVETELNIEYGIGYSWVVDKEAVEGVQLRVGPLRTINCGLGSWWEGRLDEVLFFSVSREGEGSSCL